MPCRDVWPTDEIDSSSRQAKWFEAVVCGIFTQMESQPIEGLLDDILDNLDYEEMGVTRGEIEGWWKAHKKADIERRKREEAARLKEERRAAALSKLTKEEREALGV